MENKEELLVTTSFPLKIKIFQHSGGMTTIFAVWF